MREVPTQRIQQPVGCNERCGERSQVFGFGRTGSVERGQPCGFEAPIELSVNFREHAGRGFEFLSPVPRHRKPRARERPPEPHNHAPRRRVTREVVGQFDEREVGRAEQMDMVVRRNLRGLDRRADDIGGMPRRSLHRRFRNRDALVLAGEIAQTLSRVRVPDIDQPFPERRSEHGARVIQIAFPRLREHMTVALDHQTLEAVKQAHVPVDIPFEPITCLVGVRR